MSSQIVDGVRVPDAVGGHPALDFCNTRAGWGEPAPKEYLTQPRVLTVWAGTVGLLPSDRKGEGAADEVRAAAAALARAVALREALYACALRRGTPDDWALVSREAAAARSTAVLVPAGEAPAAWRPDPALGPVEAALTAVAAAAEDLLTSSLAQFVAACPGEGCGWLFADRRRKRRWCSMAACGNRAKARRYAERRSAG